MKKLFMKLCGQVRKLRSSQPTLQPMNVKITLHSDVEFQSILFDFDKTKVNVKMDYYDWMQYLHDEIEEYKERTRPLYYCSSDKEKRNGYYHISTRDNMEEYYAWTSGDGETLL